MKTLITDSVAALQRAGELLGKVATGGEVVILSGQLGAGKTTFTQGVARGLGISTPVTSPTFTLIHTYIGRLTLVHCDFYRLKSHHEALNIGFLDYLSSESLVLVEWGETYLEIMPPNYITIDIEPYEQGRQLDVASDSKRGQELIEKWVSLWQS